MCWLHGNVRYKRTRGAWIFHIQAKFYSFYVFFIQRQEGMPIGILFQHSQQQCFQISFKQSKLNGVYVFINYPVTGSDNDFSPVLLRTINCTSFGVLLVISYRTYFDDFCWNTTDFIREMLRLFWILLTPAFIIIDILICFSDWTVFL